VAKISDFHREVRSTVRETIEKIKGFSWKVYEDPAPKRYLALKMYGYLICAFYPVSGGFSIGYFDAPAGRPGVDRWVRRKVLGPEELPLHLAMVHARVIYVLTGTR
jgi:hypothetical protein